MSDAPSKSITILHLSDLHAGQRFNTSNQAGPKALSIDDRCARMFEWFHKYTFGTLKDQRIDLLVLSGDLTHTGHGDEYKALIDKFIEPLVKTKLFNAVVAVPGNHDVNWRRVRESVTNDSIQPLEEFHSRITERRFDSLPGKEIVSPRVYSTDDFNVLPLDHAQWCQVVPFNSVNLGGVRHPDILRHLKLVRSDKPGLIPQYHESDEMFEDKRLGEIPPVNPAYVSDDDLTMARYKLHSVLSGGRIPFRIAVIHHNPLAYPAEAANPKPYRFLNDGAFNDFLIKNDFRLVLHGHQHAAELLSFSNASNRPEQSWSGLGSGFVCLGAPSFGADDASGFGFNIVRIEPGLSTYAVGIQRLNWGHGRGGGLQAPTKIESDYIVPLEDLDKERRALLNKLSTMVLNQVRLPDLRRDADIGTTPFEAELFERLRQERSVHKNIRAMYSLSVFGPELWTDTRHAEFFLPEARRNIARAAALAKSLEARYQSIDNTAIKVKFQEILSSGTPNLLFRFSSPLYHAPMSAVPISPIH